MKLFSHSLVLLRLQSTEYINLVSCIHFYMVLMGRSNLLPLSVVSLNNQHQHGGITVGTNGLISNLMFFVHVSSKQAFFLS